METFDSLGQPMTAEAEQGIECLPGSHPSVKELNRGFILGVVPHAGLHRSRSDVELGGK